jgi:hypothetical protein
MTSDFAADLQRARWDVEFFALRFLGIRLNAGQKRLAQAYLKRTKSGWRAAYLWIMAAAGNRAGKTLGLAIIVFHSCFYKMGQEPPDVTSEKKVKRWLEAAYVWYHFGLEQENADVVFEELRAILEGRHEAQKELDANGDPIGCPLVTELGGIDQLLAQPIDKKYKGDYPWIKFHPRFGGADIHFRSVAQKALGSLGRDMHGLSFDECGIVGAKLPFLLNEVMHWRRLGTGGQFLLISTASEDIGPEFADLWYTGDPESGDYKPRRYSIRISTRENIGFGIDPEMFDALVEGMDESIIAQNIDGYFIQGKSAYFNAGSINNAFVDWLPERIRPRRRHVYVQGVDPALRYDSAWSIVLDVLWDQKSDRPVAVGVYAERRRGKITTPQLVDLAAGPQNSYDNPGVGSRCSTAIDATGFGGKMFREALENEVQTVRAIEFGGSLQKKRKLLGDLRTLLDEGRLLLPRHGIWLHVRRQLLGYKIEDRSIEQDAVMALVCAVAEVRRLAQDGDTSQAFEYHAVDTDLPTTDGRRWSRTPYRHTPRAEA